MSAAVDILDPQKPKRVAIVASKKIQPFRIEDEAKRFPGTNFMVAGRFKAHAVRDGNLITGQQQYSGAAVARLVIEALGV